MHNEELSDKLTFEEIEEFRKTHKLDAPRMLSFLGRISPFIEVMRTEIGLELMADLIRIAEEKLILIADEKADENDRAEYRVSKRLLVQWQSKIYAYLKNVRIIKQEAILNGGKRHAETRK